MNITAPAGKTYRPFQVEGIRWITSRQHSLLADEMGLGKTVQAIGAVNSTVCSDVLIICPASVKLNWLRELHNWLVISRPIQILNKRTDIILDSARIVIVNYDLVWHSHIFEQVVKREWDILFCDEAHYLKSKDANRTKAILAKGGLVHRCKRTVMMTGTPVLNRPIELYPILKVLSPETIHPYRDYYKFAMRYCNAWHNGLTLDVRGASNEEDLNKRLRASYMLRRIEKDVEDQLPPKRYQTFLVDPSNEKSLLTQLEKAHRTDFRGDAGGLSGGDLAQMRRELALGKVHACREHIHGLVEQAGKLVIFTYHRDVTKYLIDLLKEYNPVSLTGETSQQGRQQAIATFMDNVDCQVFIGQIQAAGQGIDGLQFASSHILFAEWSWVPGEVSQAIKRVHRMGQEQTVHIQFLVWADSLEEHIMRTALDKVETIDKIVN